MVKENKAKSPGGQAPQDSANTGVPLTDLIDALATLSMVRTTMWYARDTADNPAAFEAAQRSWRHWHYRAKDLALETLPTIPRGETALALHRAVLAYIEYVPPHSDWFLCQLADGEMRGQVVSRLEAMETLLTPAIGKARREWQNSIRPGNWDGVDKLKVGDVDGFAEAMARDDGYAGFRERVRTLAGEPAPVKAEPKPLHLRDVHLTILAHLQKEGRLVQAAEMDGKSGMPGYDTLLVRLGELEDATLVHRPGGPRSGYEIRPAGVQVLRERDLLPD
jgi:hypothetical protein